MSAPYKMQLNNYEFSITPPFQPRVSYTYDDRRNLFAEQHTWPIQGHLKSTGGTNLFTKYEDLKDAIETAPFDIKFLDSNDNVLSQVLTTDTDGKGPRCTRINIPAVNAWATSVQFGLEVTALIKRHADKSDGIININYTDTYTTEHKEDGTTLEIVTRSGSLETDASTSALIQARAQRALFLTGFNQFEFTADDISTTEDDSQATFTWTRRQREQGGASTDDSRTKEESESDGLLTTTWSGTFSGPSAESQALNFKPPVSAGPLVARDITRNADNGEVSVKFTRIKAIDGSGIVNVQENISVAGGDQPLIPALVQGFPPVRFRGRQTAVTVIQNVTLRATSVDALIEDHRALVPFPDGLTEEDLSTKSFSPPSVARFTTGGIDAEWTMTFTRTFVVPDVFKKEELEFYLPTL